MIKKSGNFSCVTIAAMQAESKDDYKPRQWVSDDSDGQYRLCPECLDLGSLFALIHISPCIYDDFG